MRAGYSPRSAKKSAWNNLGRPEIATAIAEGQARRLAAVEMRAEAVLAELAAIARGNILDHMRSGAQGAVIIDPAGIERGKAAALCDVTVEPFAEGRGKARRKGRRIRIGMHDKIAALDRLARHYGLFREGGGQEMVEAPLLSAQDRRQAVEAVLAFILDGQEKDGERPREGSVDPKAGSLPKALPLPASPHRSRIFPTSPPNAEHGSRWEDPEDRRPRMTASNAGGTALTERQKALRCGVSRRSQWPAGGDPGRV